MTTAKILVVDGNFNTRVALRQALIFFGAVKENIRAEKNLDTIKAIGRDFQPQIVLLDEGMGTDAIRILKGTVQFILICSPSSEDILTIASKMGVEVFVSKPYSQIQIGDALKKVMQKIS